MFLDKSIELLIFGKQGSDRLIFLSQGPADLLNTLDHLADLLLLIRDVLLNRLKPSALSLHYLINLFLNGLDEGRVVRFRLVLLLVGQPSQFVDVHLLVVDGHLELLDQLLLLLVLGLVPPNRHLQLLDGGLKLVDILLRHICKLVLIKVLLGDLELVEQVLDLLALLLQALVRGEILCLEITDLLL